MPPRVRSQLALQLPPELITRIRAAAVAQGRSITALTRAWLEAGLAALEAAAAGADDAIARIDAMERRLQALECRPAAAVAPVLPTDPPECLPAPPPLPERLRPASITAPELAALAGRDVSGITRWSAGHPIGSVWHHPTAGSWRLRGKVGRSWRFEPA